MGQYNWSHLIYEEDKEFIDLILRTGKFVYQVKYNQKAGRKTGYLVNKDNKNERIEIFFLKFIYKLFYFIKVK